MKQNVVGMTIEYFRNNKNKNIIVTMHVFTGFYTNLMSNGYAVSGREESRKKTGGPNWEYTKNYDSQRCNL